MEAERINQIEASIDDLTRRLNEHSGVSLTSTAKLGASKK